MDLCWLLLLPDKKPRTSFSVDRHISDICNQIQFLTITISGNVISHFLNCKEVQPVHPKGDQSWVSIGKTDAKAETPILWPPHVKD